MKWFNGLKRAVIDVTDKAEKKAIMDVMPIMTIIAWMVTMTLIISVNMITSAIMKVVILGDVINKVWYGYGHNGISGLDMCNGHIGCYEHIVVMTKNSLVALLWPKLQW